MSRTSALTFYFYKDVSKKVYTMKFIEELYEAGWILIKNEKQFYLPSGIDDESYDWEYNSIKLEVLFSTIFKKIENNESPLGVEIYLTPDQEYGHLLHIYNDQKIMLSLIEPVEMMAGYSPSIDISLYTEILFNFFIDKEYIVESYDFAYS